MEVTGPAPGRWPWNVWIRVIAGVVALGLFGVLLLLFHAALETTAEVQVEAGPDARPRLDQPVLCQAISGRGRSDSVVTQHGSTEQVSPLYGDTTDVISKCGDARASQGTRMVLWAVPTILLGVVAVTPRDRAVARPARH